MKVYKVTGIVDIFPEPSGWHFVRVPKEQTDPLTKAGAWGMVPVEVTLGNTTWNTSLLPMGQGQYFIALKQAVRKKEKVGLGDTITCTYRV
jgi:hypothetical protein